MNGYLIHHGIKGQRWGIRRFQNEDGSLTRAGAKRYDVDNNGNLVKKQKEKSGIGKTIGISLGGAAVGAAAVGTAWFLKNQHNEKVKKLAIAARTKKMVDTKAARKAAGYYEKFKNVDVIINKGGDFVKGFSNVKLAKILPR